MRTKSARRFNPLRESRTTVRNNALGDFGNRATCLHRLRTQQRIGVRLAHAATAQQRFGLRDGTLAGALLLRKAARFGQMRKFLPI